MRDLLLTLCFDPYVVYGLAVQAVVDQPSYNQLYAGLEAFAQV